MATTLMAAETITETKKKSSLHSAQLLERVNLIQAPLAGLQQSSRAKVHLSCLVQERSMVDFHLPYLHDKPVDLHLVSSCVRPNYYLPSLLVNICLNLMLLIEKRSWILVLPEREV